ncbi:MAG: hemerythrin domain-containing protein [Nitrosarchaeum sp.]|nr:hemerythrin domain-containing protein [Nitrosarchaeum sp.]
MSATDQLRKDHVQVRRLEKIVLKCAEQIASGENVPFSDIEKILVIIYDFLDAIHHSREEDSYFPCVASYDSLKDEIRGFMIEHEFGRNIARQISKHLQKWRQGHDAREPVSRFLKTYGIYLYDHLNKENNFFDKAEAEVLTKEEEIEMYEQYRSVTAITKKVDDMIEEIDFLEKQPWFVN